ncbi:hypothetical protein CAEBREN_05411 [Caenorhabditis brenneri]|uniref:Uncharacterized protein n=1 Tax=Caenorhabditis brenneri TaxID=135651 RepID=G0PIR0_CAEBE|nr:hypothetical protein CAEBREN_05411 [Caenorhabditis brenneri]
MSPDPTAPTTATTNTTTDTGRKRRNEVELPSAKRSPRSLKEEKENEVNQQPTTSSANSSTSNLEVFDESMESPETTTTTTTTGRRKKGHPRRLEDVQKTLKTSSDPNELHEYYKRNETVASRNVRFLVQNVVHKKILFEGKAICRERVMPKIQAEADRLLERQAWINDHHHLATLDFTKINSWGNSMDASNFDTSACSVQAFAVLLDSQNRAKLRKLGMAVISLTQKRLNEEDGNQFNTKKIYLPAHEFVGARKIYIVVIVKRMVAKEEKRGATRKAAAGASSANAKTTPQVLEQKMRIGALLIYDSCGRNLLNNGIERIILVDSTEKPEFEAIFTEMLSSPTEWMKATHNLEILAKQSLRQEDQHLPRILFTSEATRFSKIFNFLQNRAAELPVKYEQIEEDRRLYPGHKDARKDARWLTSRFPCYEFPPDEETGLCRPVQNVKYFESDTVETHENECLFRPVTERSKGRRHRRIIRPVKNEPVEPMEVDDEIGMDIDYDVEMDHHHEAQRYDRYSPQPPINIGPDGKRLSGLQFKFPKGHSSYAPCTFGNRAVDQVPHLDEQQPKTYRKEEFIRHNPRVYTEFQMREKRIDDLPAPEYRKRNQEMYVVQVPATQQQIDIYNKELEKVKITRKVNPDLKHSNDGHPIQPGCAIDGLPVPTFAEMFFPTGKSEIYNILLRYYLTEVGTRAGSFSPEWRSRVLTGFVEKYNEHIFTHDLSEQFEKQLQCMALTSHIKWKPEHFNRPWQKLAELRNKWEAEHPRARSPAPNDVPGPSSQPSTSSHH